MEQKHKHHKRKKALKAAEISKPSKPSKQKPKRKLLEETKAPSNLKKHKAEPESKPSITAMKLSGHKKLSSPKASTLRISVGCYSGTLWIYECSVDKVEKGQWEHERHKVSDVILAVRLELAKELDSKWADFGYGRI